jgi:hypothetical protein
MAITSIGQKIYNLLLSHDINPIDVLRNITFEFPENVDEVDIDHKFGTDADAEQEYDNPHQKPLPFMEYAVELNDGLDKQTFMVSGNTLYNKNGIVAGYCNSWIDEDLEIPDEFKKQNMVLHPETGAHLSEYYLCHDSPYHDLQTDNVYREFKYDYGLHRLIAVSAAKVVISSNVNI